MKKDLQAGQTLLEMLVALGASVLILSAITVIVITSLSGTQFTKNQNLANQYAQEGIEVVRRIRDNSWVNFLALSDTNYCLPKSQTNLTSKPAGGCSLIPNVGIFLREIEIAHTSAFCPNPVTNGSRVTSKTFWSDGKCPDDLGDPDDQYCHKVELSTCLHNINIVPTP